MAVIAPFWATTDTYFAFKKNHSRVYYQVYEESKESSSNILDMAAKHVQNYSEGFSNFQASWVLVVTWENLCPYVYYPYYYYYYGDQEIELNCRWVSKYVWLIKLVHTHSYYILKQWIASKARFDCLLKIQFEILFAIHLRTFTRGVYALKYCNRCGNKWVEITFVCYFTPPLCRAVNVTTSQLHFGVLLFTILAAVHLKGLITITMQFTLVSRLRETGHFSLFIVHALRINIHEKLKKQIDW